MIDDLRYALRSLAKRPLFALVTIGTLGLGIGANSAIFSLVNAALWAPLHVAEPERLLNVYTTDTAGRGFNATSYPDYAFLRDNTRRFSGVFGYSGLMTTVTGGSGPEVLFGELVTGNYFAVSGARLQLGRGFLPDEDAVPGARPVAVISDGLWKRRFAGARDVLGKQVTLNGHPFTIVGVAAPEFRGLLFRGISADVWAPTMMMAQLRTDQLSNRDERWMFVKARLRDGVSVEQGRAELATLAAQLAREYPETNRGRTFASVPTSDVLLHPAGDRAVMPAAGLLMLIVGFVLLIACTNLANLLLARAAARRREVAVRLALGATRGRLVRQFVVESSLLALLGGAVGLVLAVWLAHLLIAFKPPIPVPVAIDVAIDARVVLYTVLASVLASIVFGLAPALHASRTSVAAALTSHALTPGRSRMLRVRDFFLVPQLALSLVLLVVATLLVRSLTNADRVHPGFDMEHTALVALDLRLDGYDETRAAAFYANLSERVARSSGVRAMTITDRIPLDMYGNQTTTVSLTGATAGGGDRSVQYARADARYFDALGVRVVRGRAISDADVRNAAPVVVVSEQAARVWWPGVDPIGQRLREGNANREVVGVVADTKIQTLGEDPQPFVYVPIQPRYDRLLRFIVRTSGDPAALVPVLRREVRAIDPNVAIFEAKTMLEHLDVMLFPYRLGAGVSTVLGAFGLLLASIGLYGVVAFGVARRTRELGIRMAIGARPADVLRMMMGESMRVVAIGLAVGVVLSIGIAKLLEGILFGIGAADPVTLIGVPLALGTVALAATWLPARRATLVSPAVALRED